MRRQTLHLLAGASVPAALYVLYVAHYAVDVPYSDDYNMVPVVNSALTGHLSISELWSQYGDTRLLTPKLFFVLFAFVDHYNVKHLLLFSALILAASYLLLLLLLRSYLGKPLTVVPVVAVAVIWFSLADHQNALWSFQLPWYLVMFFFVAMLYVLLAPRRLRTMFFGVGILAAVAASFSIVQGFVLWPVGLICVLWNGAWGRRMSGETLAWISAAALTAAIYLPGFDTNSACSGTSNCEAGYGLAHPWLLLRFIVLLIGSVVPTSYSASATNLYVHEVVGTAIALAAAFVVVQSIRERRTQTVPLPLLLIVFSFLFDGLIAIGRFGGGPAGALLQVRYTMPNLVLLAGMVIYACAHLPASGRDQSLIRRRASTEVLGSGVVVALVLVQCVAATRIGIKYGRSAHHQREVTARVVVNIDRIPLTRQACAAAFAVIPPESPEAARRALELHRANMEREQLSLFQPATFRRYRAEGPPTWTEIVTAGEGASVAALWASFCA